MSFNSVEFALLLLAVLALHWTVPARWRNLVVLAASYVFYGWWDWRFLGLLVGSTLLDFTVSQAIHDSADPVRRRRLLLLSVCGNLGVLAAFKYAGFFLDSLVGLLGSLGLGANPVLLSIVLPVGISFYTFQTMGYTVDVYRGVVAPADRLLTFATYVAYFPQLVAGPIERAGRLLPQVADVHRAPPDAAVRVEAASLIVIGLVRKVVIADGLAPVVNDAFDASGSAPALMLLLGTVGFALQLYGDFAGYSAIARGVSLLLGIRLMVNFAEPYLSRTITEFWRRWHISLSTWLRDYLYIPLGGNRDGPRRTARNLMLTMLLGGLWHGAAWTFVLWGALHGLFLGAHRWFRARADFPRDDGPLRRADAPRVLGTFVLAALAFVPFRARSLAETGEVLGGLLTLRSGTIRGADVVLVVFLSALSFGLDAAQRAQARTADPLVAAPARTGIVAGAALVALLVFSGGTPEPFIYFQF